jgi:hypothetical protein
MANPFIYLEKTFEFSRFYVVDIAYRPYPPILLIQLTRALILVIVIQWLCSIGSFLILPNRPDGNLIRSFIGASSPIGLPFRNCTWF